MTTPKPPSSKRSESGKSETNQDNSPDTQPSLEQPPLEQPPLKLPDESINFIPKDEDTDPYTFATQSESHSEKGLRAGWIDAAHIAGLLVCILAIVAIFRPFSQKELAVGFLGLISIGIITSLYLRISSRIKAAIRRREENLTESERVNFADLPTSAQELIRHLQIRHDESARMHSRSLRASPVLFACGILSALASIACLSTGVWYAIDSSNATVDRWIRITALIETGTSAVLLGAIATGFFNWRRDLHKHALTFFDDMIHTRSIQTAIRLLASMQGWVDTKPDKRTYLRLTRAVASRSERQPPEKTNKPDEPPQALTPNVIERSIDAIKAISVQVAKNIGSTKGSK